MMIVGSKYPNRATSFRRQMLLEFENLRLECTTVPGLLHLKFGRPKQIIEGSLGDLSAGCSLAQISKHSINHRLCFWVRELQVGLCTLQVSLFGDIRRNRVPLKLLEHLESFLSLIDIRAGCQLSRLAGDAV